VIVRVWREDRYPARLDEYQRFEQERGLPMLRKQPGLLGVFFLRQAEDRAASLTIWEDAGAVEAHKARLLTGRSPTSLPKAPSWPGMNRWRSLRSRVEISVRRRW
jgi:hypothetical protein